MGDVSLTLVRQIAAPPEKVWDALLDPAMILEWWSPDEGPTLEAEVDARVGGALRVVFRTMTGLLCEMRGTYCEIDRPRRLVFTFTWSASPDDETRVTFELTPKDGGTELTLTHARFDDEGARDEHANGWSGTIENLRAFFARAQERTER